MKYISFCVPCYNSAAYMEHCVETLLTGGEDVEIILVNDGSTKDNTAEITKKVKDYRIMVPVTYLMIHMIIQKVNIFTFGKFGSIIAVQKKT